MNSAQVPYKKHSANTNANAFCIQTKHFSFKGVVFPVFPCKKTLLANPYRLSSNSTNSS